MAKYYAFAKPVRRIQERPANAQEIIVILSLQRDARPDTSVYSDIVVVCPVEL